MSSFVTLPLNLKPASLTEAHSTGIIPESFWAARPGAIYLSNGDGAMAQITARGVEIVDNGMNGVLFAAGNTLAHWSLTDPQDPFKTCSVFGNASYAASHGLDLLRTAIISLPLNPISKPPLCFVGPVGSGKTRLAAAIAEFFGMPTVAHNVEDFGEDSFWASLDAGGIFTLDNCDTRTKWLADAVAAAATGGCSQRRKKYTDSETVTLRARAALILTTANPSFASDPGLADRLLVLRMNRRTDETSDAELSSELVEHRDAGLSFIAHALSAALGDKKSTPPFLNQRHPDFASFGVRIGRATGRETETVTALRAAELDKGVFCIENDFIGAALIALLEQEQSFTGTASELRDKLIAADADIAAKPPSTKRLSRRLSALWPHLERAFTATHEENRKGFLIYTLKS